MAALLKLIPNATTKLQPNGTCTWELPETYGDRYSYGGPSGTIPRRSVESGRPYRAFRPSGRQVWFYKQKLYVTSDLELTPDDVAALANEAANRRRLQLEKAHALQAMTQDLDTHGRRQHIAQDVKMLVWQRDGGRCVTCESNEDLEFDHIIPLAMGGSNTARNLQLLCEGCNRRKGPSLG